MVTGHTGFKGSWLAVWLHSLGAKVIGVSMSPPSQPCNFNVSNLSSIVHDHRIDIRDADALRHLIQETEPNFIFHLAAQALVRTSYDSPLQTISTNAVGSANVLDALRGMESPVVVVMITSDKVYDNQEWIWGYRETDRLGGKDPYSASKGMAELAIHSYIESFFNNSESNVRVGIARAGNVIGGGDWSADRIVPDCIKAWSVDQIVDIRNPNSTRPWQHVLDPLSGYLTVAAELYRRSDKHGEAYNFGPPAHQNHSVSELIFEMAKCWGQVKWNDVSKARDQVYEAGLLKLNCDKSLFDLKWLPTLRFEETVQLTVEWYKEYYRNIENSMYDFSIKQIQEYTALAKERSINWAAAGQES